MSLDSRVSSSIIGDQPLNRSWLNGGSGARRGEAAIQIEPGVEVTFSILRWKYFLSACQRSQAQTAGK